MMAMIICPECHEDCVIEVESIVKSCREVVCVDCGWSDCLYFLKNVVMTDDKGRV